MTQILVDKEKIVWMKNYLNGNGYWDLSCVNEILDQILETEPSEYPNFVNDYGFLTVIRCKEEDWTLTKAERL